MIVLIPSVDSDFDWMLGLQPSIRALTLPPGGVDDPGTLAVVRRMNTALLRTHDRGAWMVVQSAEVVGLCGYLRAPAAGEVEIGFGIAASRRNRGYAAAAVAAMVIAAGDDPLVNIIVARTAVGNIASQRVLARNWFVQAGSEVDDEDGPVLLWRRSPARILA
jgi:RimJ/RimL family protein N-acetyltransferase